MRDFEFFNKPAHLSNYVNSEWLRNLSYSGKNLVLINLSRQRYWCWNKGINSFRAICSLFAHQRYGQTESILLCLYMSFLALSLALTLINFLTFLTRLEEFYLLQWETKQNWKWVKTPIKGENRQLNKQAIDFETQRVINPNVCERSAKFIRRNPLAV